MSDSECYVDDIMECDDSPIYSPHSPDYMPDFSMSTSVNQRKIYGEKINSLDRLVCEPIGERNVLIEQLTFRPLNDVNSNADEAEEADAVCGVTSVTSGCCGGSGGGIDNESLSGANVPSIAASVASAEEYNTVASIAASCGGTEVGGDYENKTTGIIIIPSPTVRVYSSFVINRRSIPKLCFVCFRSYCVCAKNGIDNVTRDHYEARNYEFFRDSDTNVGSH